MWCPRLDNWERGDRGLDDWVLLLCAGQAKPDVVFMGLILRGSACGLGMVLVSLEISGFVIPGAVLVAGRGG